MKLLYLHALFCAKKNTFQSKISQLLLDNHTILILYMQNILKPSNIYYSLKYIHKQPIKKWFKPSLILAISVEKGPVC